jgi:hypothetical protein
MQLHVAISLPPLIGRRGRLWLVNYTDYDAIRTACEAELTATRLS